MSKLVCPHCGTPTSPTLAYFAASVSRRVAAVDGGASVRIEDGEAGAVTPLGSGQPSYGIIVCQACGRHFVAERDPSQGWSAVYPISHRPVADEVPEPIRSQFTEACLCFAVGAYGGCLLMCRTTLIALQRQQGVSSLKELKEKEVISGLLYGQADQVRLWANMMAHEDVPESIASEDSEQLLIYLESLLDDVYVKPARLAVLSQKRKQLEKGTTQPPT